MSYIRLSGMQKIVPDEGESLAQLGDRIRKAFDKGDSVTVRMEYMLDPLTYISILLLPSGAWLIKNDNNDNAVNW